MFKRHMTTFSLVLILLSFTLSPSKKKRASKTPLFFIIVTPAVILQSKYSSRVERLTVPKIVKPFLYKETLLVQKRKIILKIQQHAEFLEKVASFGGFDPDGPK
mmetsp:Transcript_8968/g.11644  ORF Transcript_8968/g.11644 Transcript_8968/m.11644 type:complete len:104 (-) Transcript_8968:1023-1334(-)